MPTPSRTLRAASVLLVALALTLAGTEAAVGAPAPRQAATAPAPSNADRPDAPLDLSGDSVLPQRNGRSVRVRKWKVRTLRYHETLPAKWDWSLSTAVAKWNASGARIRFVRTPQRGRAHLTIGMADTGKAAGVATVGATRNARVRLSSRFASMDAHDARNRVTVMRVLAHELGHVLGFQHTRARCSLMAPVLDLGACGVLAPARPGYYACRTLDTALVKRFVQVYGGRARLPGATWCPIDPLPFEMNGVNIFGGGSSPLTITWSLPAFVPAGSRVELTRWTTASTCGAAPLRADTFRLALRPGTWQDQGVAAPENACFRVQLQNRYGASRHAVTLRGTRWVSPHDRPKIAGGPVYDSSTSTFELVVSVADGTSLEARWWPGGAAACPPTADSGSGQSLTRSGDLVTIAATGQFPRCVSFFAVDPGHTRDSARTSVVLTVPGLTAPQVSSATWHAERPAFRATALYRADTRLVYAVDEADPTNCPGAYTGGTAVVEDEATIGAGLVEFLPPHPDACVSFYAVNQGTGAASAPTTVRVHAPVPTEAVTVDSFEQDPWSYPLWNARLSAAPGYEPAMTIIDGACPTEPPTGVHWSYFNYNDGPTPPSAGYEDIYATFSRAAGPNCALFTTLDWFGRMRSVNSPAGFGHHGPVVMREFTNEGPVAPTLGTPVWEPATEEFMVPFAGGSSPGIRAVFDPSDPTTCPSPGQAGVTSISMRGSDQRRLKVPVLPACVTFFTEADGPVRTSRGVEVQFVAPASNG